MVGLEAFVGNDCELEHWGHRSPDMVQQIELILDEALSELDAG